MEKTAEDPKVMIALSQNQMLSKLQASQSLLEDIQKGLNDYLETKRIFFPRYCLN